jgi:uncharacterized lipoprotein YmbA
MTIRRAVPVLVTMLAAGCGFLSSKPSLFYSLDRLPPTGAIAAGPGLPIGVDVVLPPGLDRKEIAVRQPDRRLDIRGREQWTASLEAMVLSTLAFDLADRLPEGMVILPGQPKPDRAMRSLDVVFEELAAGPDRSVVLDARWTLRQTGRADLSRHEHIAIDAESLTSPNIAMGMSRALAALADRIVPLLNAG